MRKIGIWLCLALVCVSITGSWRSALAQTNDEYFEETGHWVMGEFLAFYRSIENPTLIYGYPVTEAFPENSTGMMVQYFQKARFELHPSEPSDRRVQLTPVGTILYTSGQPELNLSASGACRSFIGRSYEVCYTFLDFYQANGGEQQFGYPISNFETHDGVIVQYFERARFEWLPGINGGSRVVLSDLGMQYFYEKHEDIRRIGAQLQDDNILQGGVLRLRARAYPEQAVTERSGYQGVYILVQDQRLLPVENVDVSLLVRLPDGDELRVIAPKPTDENGITHIPFTFRSDQVGMASVEIVAVRDRVEARTATSFRIWY